MDRTVSSNSPPPEEPDFALQEANEEPPLPRFSIRRKGTQINLGLILLIALGITSVVVGTRSFDEIEAAVSQDIEELVQPDELGGRPLGELDGPHGRRAFQRADVVARHGNRVSWSWRCSSPPS